MRKNYIRSVLLLLLLLVALFSSTSVSAEQITPKKIAEDMIKNELSYVQSLWNTDNPSEWIKDQNTTGGTNHQASVVNYPYWIGSMIKTAAVTMNPQNVEQGIIPQVQVKSDESPSEQATAIIGRYSLLSLDEVSFDDIGELQIIPLIVYSDDGRNLNILMKVDNRSGDKIRLNGINAMEVIQDGKVIASGETELFDSPMIYSKRSERKEDQIIYVNKGVDAGYPTTSFLKVTFEPGTYTDGLDITELNNVVVRYELNYSILD